MDNKWIEDNLTNAQSVDNMAEREQDSGSGSTRGCHKISKSRADLASIINNLENGASYLNVHNRVMVKSPDLESLDNAVRNLKRSYRQFFKTLSVALFVGQPRDELTVIFRSNETALGKGFHFTSNEFAGSYSLVTSGLSDRGGEYVGMMESDVNTSAVLLDVDLYRLHVGVASNDFDPRYGRVPAADVWGSTLSQRGRWNRKPLGRLGSTVTNHAPSPS